MGTANEIIDAIKAIADARNIDTLRASIGSTGQHVEISGQRVATGLGWEGGDTVFTVIVEGIAQFLDGSGIGGFNIKRVTGSDPSPPSVDVGAKDQFVEVITGAANLSLPDFGDVSEGKQLVFKATDGGSADISGDADIEGSASYSLLADSVLRLYRSQTEWKEW